MSHPEGLFLDKDSQPSILSAVGVFLGGVAAGVLAYFVGGWIGIVIAVFAALLAAAGVAIFLGTRHPEWYQRTMLTERGLIQSHKGKQTEVVPVEAIEAVGLHVRFEELVQLVLWYDRSMVTELPFAWRIAEFSPGVLRLDVVNPELKKRQMGYLGLADVREVREFVEAHGLGEWRHERA
ncbi:hypothetical protein [Actinomadura sp. 9N407]|uniref:hypothetical protein n=1 Tax=Actinomadura sp. 9N407 TaxID=3375154 RepID=UPI0037B87920